MANSFSFEDAFRQIVDVNEKLLAGKIDTATAIAHHNGSVALDKMLNTAIKMRIAEANIGGQLAPIGDVKIFERKAIDIDPDAVKRISDADISETEEVKKRLPKVGVIGMNPTQAGAIIATFGESAEFEFWKDDGENRLRSLGMSCDVIFVNLGNASHKYTQMLDAMDAEYIRVQNGTSNMKSAIKKYFAERE